MESSRAFHQGVWCRGDLRPVNLLVCTWKKNEKCGDKTSLTTYSTGTHHLVPVAEEVPVLVVLPLVEEVGHVQIGAVVGSVGQVLDEVALEVDVVVAILKAEGPRYEDRDTVFKV